jgi:ribosomal protein S18 acetylase RimI-like enzyme
MVIRRYLKADEAQLFNMLEEEGDDWSDYYGENGRGKYIRSLESSVTYVVYDGGFMCGYARCHEDCGFGVYVYDLLVRKTHRGRQIGKKLMEKLCGDFPDQPIYVMSDVDAYYEKLGYQREGSIFKVKCDN